MRATLTLKLKISIYTWILYLTIVTTTDKHYNWQTHLWLWQLTTLYIIAAALTVSCIYCICKTWTLINSTDHVSCDLIAWHIELTIIQLWISQSNRAIPTITCVHYNEEHFCNHRKTNDELCQLQVSMPHCNLTIDRLTGVCDISVAFLPVLSSFTSQRTEGKRREEEKIREE